ncbi:MULTISPECIES: hypothetical protein [unclassified Streptomyces]|uniref:hypothetical protein n=1 Tax=Streptomyces sp. 604F TaxID=1476754 RepID=UPI001EF16530|nr:MULTISPECIES: hypothetical protein [unclassified Streptomyces]UYM23876.1 hypothetical protein NQP46_11170 [Streptomyces albus]
MNDSNGAAHSSAAYDSTIGIQAETVHNSNVYFVHHDASPQEKFRVGVQLLEDGIPSRAREMISDAIAHGYHHAEVRFPWVLAMLSGRTRNVAGRAMRERLQTGVDLVTYLVLPVACMVAFWCSPDVQPLLVITSLVQMLVLAVLGWHFLRRTEQ